MSTYITHSQLDELVAFAQDEKRFPSQEALEALANLNCTIQKNCIRHLTGARKRNAMLQEQIGKYKDREQNRILVGEINETGLDSVDVALALLYQLQQLKTYKLNKYKLQEILYEMYASWLESKKERLFLEHPVATEYGPRFWRVFKRIETITPVPQDEWRRIAALNPGVAAFCKNAALKYYDYGENVLNRRFMASKPYKNADTSHNNGKWNKEISDNDIIAWKSRENNK